MIRDLLSRFSLVAFLIVLYGVMGYCGLVLIELAFREIVK